MAVGVNDAIKKGQILWELHGTLVVSLGASVVVKIGTLINPGELTNLNYIHAHVPRFPYQPAWGASNPDAEPTSSCPALTA